MICEPWYLIHLEIKGRHFGAVRGYTKRNAGREKPRRTRNRLFLELEVVRARDYARQVHERTFYELGVRNRMLGVLFVPNITRSASNDRDYRPPEDG